MKAPGDAPDLLPARMVNEFVYCPRLFYYEHVLGVFVHNADTLRGAAQHKRVDGGKGALPVAKPAKTEKKQTGGKDKSEEGAQAPQNESPEVIHSRSVMLGSESLGVTCKLDLIEIRQPSDDLLSGLVVRPVEYKAGSPREGDDGKELWDTDKVQLGLQIMLLRENGYSCDEGVVFYRETRQRVNFVLDDETEAWIRRTLVAARDCTLGSIPPPLDSSPKCPRCSLVSVCLPDETSMLRQPPEEETNGSDGQLDLGIPLLQGVTPSPPRDVATLIDWPDPKLPALKPGGAVRRLIAPDADTRALYINTSRAYASKKGEIVVIKEKDAVIGEVRVKDLHHLAVFGPVQISTALIQTLCEKDVPISYFSMGGWFYGLTRGHGLKNVLTRIEQFKAAADPEQSLFLARLFAYGKVRNQRTLLMRNHVEPPPLALKQLKHAASATLTANSLGTLLGIEGAAALVYFQNFSGMIKADPDEPSEAIKADRASPQTGQLAFNFDFQKRNRRPPKDPVNALLSLAYSLLVRDCTIAAYAVGFDPYVGFFHQPKFGKPALALDLMEEFRPLIADSVVLTVINNKMVGPKDFVQAGDAVNLTPSGRKAFFFAYEKRLSDVITHPVFDYKVSYRRAIELQFRLLAKTVTGEIEQYVPFMTR